jgi:eukaryotic-like serine/threonine-protein kinase
VWRARDLRSGAQVAVKVLARHDAGLLLRFVHEQSVRIRHPHVLAPTGWAAEDDLVVLVMELVRGGSVHDLLAAHGALPEGHVRILLDQILQALVAVHAAGVVHRDLKPANLLLDPTGHGRPHLRLADFGIAATVAEQRLVSGPGPIGTDGYIAPEQLAAAPPDPRQDLYAAGRVAAELLTGARASDEAPGGPLGPLLHALTEPEPERRTPTAAAALTHLRALGVPPGAPAPVGPFLADRMAPHRRRGLLGWTHG